MIIIMGLGKNNVLCPKYIDIFKFRGGRGIEVLVYYSKNRKKYKRKTYTKIKFYIIFIPFFFLWSIIKKLRNMGPKNLRKGWPIVNVTELQCAWWRLVIPPHCVDNILAFEERGDSVPELLKNIFFLHFPPLTFL